MANSFNSEDPNVDEEPLDLFKGLSPDEIKALKVGRPLSEEHKKKISEAHLGKIVSEETKRAQTLGQLRRWAGYTLEEKKRIRKNGSEAQILRFKTSSSKTMEEHGRNISKAKLGIPLSPEHRKAISEGSRNKGPVSEATRKKISEGNTGKSRSFETRMEISNSQSKRWASLSPEIQEVLRDKNSKAQKERWAKLSEEEFSWWARANAQGRSQRPNGPESDIKSTLDLYLPGEWEYTGNYSFWVGHKNPDFTHKNKKEVIEHFGIHYHDPQYFPEKMSEEATVAYYKERGYCCVVLWEDKLCSEYIIGKVKELDNMLGGYND